MTTQCREVLGRLRCELPGGHPGRHRCGDVIWTETMPEWLRRASERRLPAKVLT